MQIRRADFLIFSCGDLRGTLSNASQILNPRMGECPVSIAVPLVRGRGSQPSQHPVAIRLTTAAPRFSASLLSRSRLRAKRGYTDEPESSARTRPQSKARQGKARQVTTTRKRHTAEGRGEAVGRGQERKKVFCKWSHTDEAHLAYGCRGLDTLSQPIVDSSLSPARGRADVRMAQASGIVNSASGPRAVRSQLGRGGAQLGSCNEGLFCRRRCQHLSSRPGRKNNKRLRQPINRCFCAETCEDLYSAQGAHLHASPGAETRANLSTPVYADGRIRARAYRVNLHAGPLAGFAIYACLRASPEHHASCQLQGRLPLAATFIPDRDRIPRRWRRRRPDARHGQTEEVSGVFLDRQIRDLARLRTPTVSSISESCCSKSDTIRRQPCSQNIPCHTPCGLACRLVESLTRREPSLTRLQAGLDVSSLILNGPHHLFGEVGTKESTSVTPRARLSFKLSRVVRRAKDKDKDRSEARRAIRYAHFRPPDLFPRRWGFSMAKGSGQKCLVPRIPTSIPQTLGDLQGRSSNRGADPGSEPFSWGSTPHENQE
ncbi:hypothetical protein L1887_50179 [Cichorium endivia]|nr:hypothetical protein L1887_50179 [Cichorium endivia]